MNKLLRVLSYHVWLAAPQMPCDDHLKTGLSDIRYWLGKRWPGRGGVSREHVEPKGHTEIY
eukprot:bmy_01780T0